MTKQAYAIRLSLADAARIEALAEMYPNMGVEEIITDLIGSALDELETSMPYVQGTRVIAKDEFGDPIYEDIGPSARFHAAAKRHREALQTEPEQA